MRRASGSIAVERTSGVGPCRSADRPWLCGCRHVPAGSRLHGIGAHLYDGTDPAERIRAMREADEVRWVERQVEIGADIRAERAARQEPQ